MVEKLLHWYSVCHGFTYVALRYFNAAGADPEGQIGEDHDPETHLIPLTISAALRAVPCLEIYGGDYDTPDGTAIRDYLHVTDLADAHVAALRYLDRGGKSTAFNLGTGRGASVREVVRTVEQVTGCTVPVREVARRSGDPPSLVADAGKAAGMLAWRPSRSLGDIVQTAWKWIANSPRHSAGVTGKSGDDRASN
jgi:UDP-glucose 4-epimerase